MAKSMNDLLNTDVDAIVEKGQEGFRKSRKKAIKTLILLMVVCVIGAAGYFAYGQIQLWQRYNNAVELMNGGEFEKAIREFKELGNYSNSAEMINETKYQRALKYLEDGKYTYAIADFRKLGEYKDSADVVNEIRYNLAVEFMESGQYDKAIVFFKELGDYKDSKEKVNALSIIEIDLNNYEGTWIYNPESGTAFFGTKLKVSMDSSYVGDKEESLIVTSESTGLYEEGRFYKSTEGIKCYSITSSFHGSELKLIDSNTLAIIDESGTQYTYTRE